MLDAFFAGRRRPACAPPPSVTSAPTMSPYTSEELIGMYTSRSSVVSPPDGVYVPSNRSSYSPGEARKSLLAYMDSDNYSYHEAGGQAADSRSRPVSVVVARGAAPPSGEVLAATIAASDTTAATGGSDYHPDARTPRSAVTQQQQGFLASVWALGRYLSVATASSTREVVNDVVTMAAGFKREKRSYAASVGSSANMDDFVGSEEGESVTEEEFEEEDEDLPYRPDTVDKGKSREILAGYQPGGPSNRDLSHDPTPSPPSTATETVVAADHRVESETETETVVPAVVSEVDSMPSTDQRPMLERHQSRSQTELRPSQEVATAVPRRSPSLTDLKEAEKDSRQDDIRDMLRESVTAAEAVAAAPGPVAVTELPAPEVKDHEPPTPVDAKVDAPAPLAHVEIPAKEEEEVAPETPPKSPLRNRSAPGSPSSSHHEFAAPDVAKVESVEDSVSLNEAQGKVEVGPEDEEEKKDDGEKEVVAAVVPEKSEEVSTGRAMPDLKDYSQALSSMLLNPSAHSTVVEASETVTAEIATSAPAISADVPVETPRTIAPIEAAEPAEPEGRQFPVAEFSDTLVSTPLPPIAEAKEEKREPVKAEESLRKISVDSRVSAFTEADAVRSPAVETKAEENTVEQAEEKAGEKAEEKPEKPPSITNAPGPGGLERRKSNAFRRDTIQRSLSMFRKKDKNKSKDSNELPAATAASTSAVELTPPPTPPNTDDQGEKGSTPAPAERPKPASRMSMFSMAKALKEKAAKEAAAATTPTATTADNDSATAAPSSTLASEADKSTPATSTESPSAPAAPEKPELKKRSSFISIAESFRSQRPSTSAGMLQSTKETEEEPKTPQRRPTFRPFSSSGDKSKSRTKSWFGGEKKTKVNDKGELVDPNLTKDKDDDAPITPDNASSIAISIAASAKEPATPVTPVTPVPETPTKESKPKFFRSQSIKRAPTFGLANRSLSSSAVSMGTTGTAATTATTATDATDSPAKSKGAARMKGLVRASTFMGMSKKKDKGKGKEVAAE